MGHHETSLDLDVPKVGLNSSRLSAAQIRDLPLCTNSSVEVHKKKIAPSAPVIASQFTEATRLAASPFSDERFEIRSELPASGFVKLFVGRDRMDRSDVLIEVCSDEANARPVLDSVSRQIRIVQKLSSPGFVRIREIQPSLAGMVVVADLPSGRTLRDEIQRRAQRQQRFTVEEVKRIGRQLCEMLRGIHQQTGHLAISPETVWCADDGSLQLAGWLSSALAVSREEVSLKELCAADQRAVAAILYELLTSIRSLDPEQSPQDVRSSIPRKLSKSVMRALAAEPAKRFPNIAAFQASLLTTHARTQQRLEFATMLGGALFLLGGLWWWMSNRPIENPNDRIEFAEQIALAEDLKKRAEQTDASILAEAKQTSDEVDKWQRELINARESRKPLQEEYAQQRLNQALPSHEIASQVAAAWKQHRQRATWTNEASSQLAKAKALSENGNIADAIVALKRADAQFWFPIRWQKNAHQAFELVRSVRTDVSGRIEKSASHPGTPFAFPKRLLEELPKKLNDDDGIAGLEDVRQAEQALPEIDRLLELRGQVTQAANLSDEISQIEEARSEVVAVEKVVHQGDDELAAGQFSKAENSYQSAIEQYAILPITAIRALLASAEVNTAANKADRRLRFIDAVFRIKAGSSNVRPLYAQAYRLRAETLLVQGKADGALEACNSAIEQDQLQSTSFLLRAAIEIQRGDFQRAVADCDAALQLEQNSVTGLIRRGNARLKMNKHEVAKGEFEKALADFTQALQLDPKNLVALSSRAAMWLEKGEAMRAIDDCSAALMLAPTSLSLLRLRATAYLQAKNFEPSLADWNAVLASDPKSHEALLGRGNTWLEMGEHNKAIEDFTSVIRQDTKNAAAFEARAKAWFKKGDQEKANSDYNSALRLTKEAPKSKPE